MGYKQVLQKDEEQKKADKSVDFPTNNLTLPLFSLVQMKISFLF